MGMPFIIGVPYEGATRDIDLGLHAIKTTGVGTFGGLVSSYTAPAADSETAFQIRKADQSTSMLNVDTANGIISIAGGIKITSNTSWPGSNVTGIWSQSELGLIFQGIGTLYDVNIVNKSGQGVLAVPTGTQNLLLWGSVSPASLADTSASNGAIYYSTTQSALVYKDSSGVVHTLY